MRLFLDCDGVLADFDSYAAEVLGMNSRHFEDLEGSDEFWRRLREHDDFFYNLPKMPDADELFAGVEQYRPVILTGCPHGGWAEIQKIRWVADHFPGTPMGLCESKNKRDFCRPGDVLVDDWGKYRDLWTEAGGEFILHDNAVDSIGRVRAYERRTRFQSYLAHRPSR